MCGGFIKLHRKMVNWEWYKDTNTFIVFIHLLFMANWKDGRFMGHVVPRGSLVTSLAHLAEDCNLSIKETRTALEHLKSTGEVTSRTTNRFTLLTVTNYGLYQDDERESANKGQAENGNFYENDKKKASQTANQRANKNDSQIPNISEFWQDGENERASQTASESANKGQTKGKQRATIEEYKNIRSNNNIINNNIVLCDSEESQTTTAKKPKSPGRFVKPTPEEIASYCRERNNNVDSSKFYDYYEANGWRVGKNPMKDWKAAVRTWEKNSYNKPVENTKPKTFTTTSKPNNTEGGLFTPEKIKVMEEFLNGD